MTWIEQLLAPGADADQARRTLFRHSEAISGTGSWAWDPQTDEMVWSDNLFRIFGLDPVNVRPSREQAVARVHPDDRERVARAIDDARLGRAAQTIAYRIRVPDSRTHYVELVAASRIAVGGRVVVIGSVRDVTDAKRAEREIAAHIAVAEALSDWDGFAAGVMTVLRRLGEAMEFERGVLWVPSEGALVPRFSWRANGEDDLLARLDGLRLRAGEGIAGRAWAAREPLGARTIPEDVTLALRKAADRDGVRSLVAIPVLCGTEALAVLCFACLEELELTDRLCRTLTGIGRELGAVLSHYRGELAPGLLTQRERDVLQLAATGCTGPEIANRLGVTRATVKTHFDNIYAKYGVPDRAAAVARALRDGVIR